MDISNCNFCYPKLRVSPSYGDAMRYHAEFREDGPALEDIENYPASFQRFITEGIIEASVDWGSADSSYRKILSDYIITACTPEVSNDPVVEVTVHSIGCRPAMTLLASTSSTIQLDLNEKICGFLDLKVTWSDKPSDKKTSPGNPEYLVMLKIYHPANNTVILRRTLHVMPPPIGPLKYRLQDIVWAPKLFKNDDVNSKKTVDRALSIFCKGGNSDIPAVLRRRRGFGLELETMRMPLNESDFDADCYTQQQEFEMAVERARTWHMNDYLSGSEDVNATVESINQLWDQFLSWSVSHDVYVENAAPPSRIDLYERVWTYVTDPDQKSDMLSNPENKDIAQALDHLVLGGKPMPIELLYSTPYDELPTSQSSPEYKSPPPPYELYHEFPARSDGNDNADTSIRLFLDGILKNPHASAKPVVVPIISDIGQSATSIHVHVNVTNPGAWPRQALDQRCDLERTQSLLCVVFAWICFDRVVQNNFCMPNVWRDRSFAPMLPTGPEYTWNEHSWEQGSSVSLPNDNGTVTGVNLYNLPAWFQHIHLTYFRHFGCQEEKKDSISIFDTVFDKEIMVRTISRWNSLNLLPIHSYGTIEFRRMHATLNSDFVSAWTWFCVGFVERFSSPSMFDKYLYPFLQSDMSWDEGLERLTQAQNYGTIEDLIEILSDEDDPVLPQNTFQVLMGKWLDRAGKIGNL